MSLVGSGDNSQSQLSGHPNDTQPITIDQDTLNISCISAGWSQTIMIDKGGAAYALGNDTAYMIGSTDRSILKAPTRIHINDELFLWAHCTQFETAYLTFNGKIIICSEKSKETPIYVNIQKPVVFISGSYAELCALDNTGAIYMFMFDPKEPPIKYQLPKPCYDIARGDGFTIAIVTDGTAYGNGLLNDGRDDFVKIPSLKGIRVVRCFAYFNHAAVLTHDSRVFTWGMNNKGQLGRGKADASYEFAEVTALEGMTIVDVALGYETSLFVTSKGDVYGCGSNKLGQLLMEPSCKVTVPTKSPYAGDTVVNVFCGDKHSLALSGLGPISHPGMLAFAIEMPKFMLRRNVSMARDLRDGLRSRSFSSRKSSGRIARLNP